jgi:hypothetical protein
MLRPFRGNASQRFDKRFSFSVSGVYPGAEVNVIAILQGANSALTKVYLPTCRDLSYSWDRQRRTRAEPHGSGIAGPPALPPRQRPVILELQK